MLLDQDGPVDDRGCVVRSVSGYACIAFSIAAGVVQMPPHDVRADEAPETGMGIVYSETEMAKGVCPGITVDEAARAKIMTEKAVDPQKPTDAFKRGVAEADARAAEAIANERLRSFCLDIVKAYGPDGTAIPGLVRSR